MLSRKIAIIGIASFDFGAEPNGSVPVFIRVGDRTSAVVADDRYAFSAVFAGGVQYWAARTLWVRGGIGIADLERDLAETAEHATVTVAKTDQFAVVAALGAELPPITRFLRRHLHLRPNFSLDAQMRYSTYSVTGLRVQNVAALAGFKWY